MRHSLKIPGTTTALLSTPSKMPGYSFSLPARKSCPHAAGTICDFCYADKPNSFYNMPSTRRAQELRYAWTKECMRTAEGRRFWVETMVEAIVATGNLWFRVHDAGDMFSPWYALCWLDVCQRLPQVQFWIPTRAYQHPWRGPLPIFDPTLSALRNLARLPNVTVRPSALNFGDHPPVVTGLHAGTTADMPDVFRAGQCPAHDQGNQCRDCRKCWTDKNLPISYRRH